MKISSDNVMTVKRDLSPISYCLFAALTNPTRLRITETLIEEPKHVKQIVAEKEKRGSTPSPMHSSIRFSNCSRIIGMCHAWVVRTFIKKTGS